MIGGKKVGGGTLRIDARKAVEKLRSYRHDDPTTWVLDALRAAVSLGATAIAVDGDADDVFVEATLDPPALEDLEDLLSELVSPEAASERRGLRLLGAALNSALAIGPSLVDVVRIDASGAETIVRYSTDPAEEPVTGAAPPRDARPESALGGPGLRIHVRRPLSLAVFGRFLVGGRLPELDHVRARAGGLAVPLALLGEPLAPEDSALLRVPLGSGFDGHLALIPPDEAEPEPMLEARELGVRLAVLPIALPELSMPRSRVPIRVVFDSPKLPTDVSRSRVRMAPPIPDVLERANACLEPLVTLLVETLEKTPTPALRDAALALLASRVAGASFVADAVRLPSTFAKLARIPLVHDATGRTRALVDLSRDTVAIHDDDEPVDPTMRSWLGQMLWAGPGMPERRLLGDATFASSSEVVRRAVAMMRAARTFRSRPIEKPVVDVAAGLLKVRLEDRVDLPFDLPEAHLDGVRGELVLSAPTSVRGELRLHLLHESRAFADLAFPTVLPFHVACDSGAIEPDETYTGVAAGDPGLARTLRIVRQAALRATLALLAALEGDDPTAFGGQPLAALESFRTEQARIRLARTAIRQLALSLAQPDGGEAAPTALLEPGSFVGHLEVFPIARGGGEERLVSLAALVQLASDGLVALAPDAVPPAGDHLCTRLLEAERALVASMLPEGTPFIPYPPPLARATASATPMSELRARASADSLFALDFEADEVRGVVARTRTGGNLVRRHRGVDVDERPCVARLLPCRVVIEDDGLVPRSGGPPLEPTSERDPFDPERRLLEAELVTVETGTAPPELVAPNGLRPSREVVREDLVALVVELSNTKDGLDLVPADLRDRLRHARIFPRVGGAAVSLAELADLAREAPVPYVSETFDAGRTADPAFVPLLASPELASSLSACFGIALEAADESIEARYAAADRRRRLEQHRARPLEVSRAPSTAITLPVEGGYARFWPSGRELGLVVRVDVEARSFATHRDDGGLPLEGEVDLGVELADAEFRELADEARARIPRLAAKAAAGILAGVAAKEPSRLVDDEAILALASAFAKSPGPKDARDTREALEGLRRAACLPTTRGRTCALSDLAPKRALLVAAVEAPDPPLAREEETSPVDREVVCLGTGTRARLLRAMLDELAHGGTRDVSRALETVLAARRIERGEVAEPTLPDAERLEMRSLGELGLDLARVAILGHGTIALSDPGGGEVRVFDAAGRRVATLGLPAELPVTIASLSPALASRAGREDPLPEAERARLEAAAKEAARALLASIAAAPDPLPERTLERVAHAVLDRGLADAALFRDLPLWVDTKGARTSVTAVAALHPDGVPFLAPDRPSLATLAPAGTLLLSKSRAAATRRLVALVDASASLEREARRADFEAQRTLDEVGLDEESRGHALGVFPIEGEGRVGELALLEPAERKRRGLVLVHRGRRLARLDDPCALPTLAIVEDHALEPNETFDGVRPSAALEGLRASIREASLRAAAGLFPPPADALASIALGPDARLPGAPSDAATGGELHLARDPGRSSVSVLSSTRASAHSIAIAHRARPGARNVPVPLEGTVVVAGAKSGPNVRPLLLAAYARLVERAAETLAGDLPDADRALVLAHVLNGRALGLVDAREPLDSLELPVTARGSVSIGSLVRSIDAFASLPITTPSDRGGVPGDVLVDDGGPIVRVLLAHLGDRARRVRSGYEHREREAPTAPVEAVFRLEPPPSVAEAPPKKSKKPRKTKKAEATTGERPARAAPAKREPPPKAAIVVPALDALLRKVRVPGLVVRRLELVPDAGDWSVRYELDGRLLLVAGRDEHVLAVADALETGDARAPTRLRSLAVRALAAIAERDPELAGPRLEAALAALLDG